MFCPKCGTENTNNASFCIDCNHELQPVRQQGAAGAPPPPPPHMAPPPYMAAQPVGSVPNYLVQAILVTLFCCLPLGIAAIVFAAQVNGKLAAGDFYGAQESSDKAKMWCWWAFGVGMAFIVLQLGIMILGMISGMAGGSY